MIPPVRLKSSRLAAAARDTSISFVLDGVVVANELRKNKKEEEEE